VRIQFDISLLAIVAALGSAAVTAEETGEVTAVENIVVTARYKTENLQETPLTISAYGETDLQKATALDLRDIGPPTPNMHIQPVVTFRNSAAVHIRGIGGQGIESTEESRVGISLNGVFIARPVATLLDLFDTEMIEVLRHGKVRRAQLYYMRNLTGKATRLRERRRDEMGGEAAADSSAASENPAPENE